VSISAFRMARQALAFKDNAGKIGYEMKGKLSSSGFKTKRFAASGEFDLSSPATTPTTQ
jgi:hypothetical protein